MSYRKGMHVLIRAVNARVAHESLANRSSQLGFRSREERARHLQYS